MWWARAWQWDVKLRRVTSQISHDTTAFHRWRSAAGSGYRGEFSRGIEHRASSIERFNQTNGVCMLHDEFRALPILGTCT
ncbi:hypothetical protein MFRU_011g02520 [Monilinia fructicola]|nr:hypothetical protein MFRU_011g02520 [Monilinia fructicola]